MSIAEISRRHFLTRLGIASAIPLLGSPADLFATFLKGQNIKLAYASITWGGKDDVAIKEIASLGFKGIQLRSNTYPVYNQKIPELKQMLDGAGLELAMFSSGNANINTGDDEKQIAPHLANAGFVKSLGGCCMQITNSSRPKTEKPTEDDLIKYARLITEIGKRTQQLGITIAYHNHMGQLGQTPEEVDIILKESDPRYINFLLDVAHYQQGGGDPAVAIRKYKTRIKSLHFKDVKDDPTASGGYRFVELGQGRVNFPAIMESLKAINYKGYAIVELDAVPVKGRTPLESGNISKEYLKKTLGFAFER